MQSKSTLELVLERLEILPDDFITDSAHLRMDMLFLLTRIGLEPNLVLPHLKRKAFLNMGESLVTPWGLQFLDEENNVRVVMKRIVPLLTSGRHDYFIRQAKVKEQLIRLAQRISEATCDSQGSKQTKLLALEKINDCLKGDSVERRLPIIEAAVLASSECSGIKENRSLHFDLEEARRYIERRSRVEAGKSRVDILENRLDRLFASRDEYSELDEFCDALIESDLSSIEKVNRLLKRLTLLIPRDLYRPARTAARVACTVLTESGNSGSETHRDILNRLAHIEMEMGQLEAAADILHEACRIELSPENLVITDSLYMEGRLALLKGAAEIAIEKLSLVRVPDDYPSYAPPRYGRLKIFQAYALLSLQQFDCAVDTLLGSTVKQDASEYPEYQTLLSLSLYKAGRPAEAKASLKEAEKICLQTSRDAAAMRPIKPAVRYAESPISYSCSLINKGDLYALMGNNLRANRLYCAAKLLLEHSDLEGSVYYHSLDERIKNTESFDLSEERFEAQLAVIREQLLENADYCRLYQHKLSRISGMVANRVKMAEAESKLENAARERNTDPESYLRSLNDLSRIYSSTHDRLKIVNPDHLARGRELLIQFVNFFIESGGRGAVWIERLAQEIIRALSVVEYFVSEEQFEVYFRQVIYILEASELEDQDWRECLTNMVTGTYDDGDANDYGVDIVGGRSRQSRDRLAALWLEEAERFHGKHSSKLLEISSTLGANS
ncbi:MAG: hypothetical protein KC777_19010 [Cyanobacteria bacterium HKST-UBA02]|nr:hypothetical protein [Cyanobacteria bacterium HKST-UBA02]